MRRVLLAASLVITGSLFAQTPKALPNSAPWEFPANIVAEQYAELRSFYESRIGEAAAHRAEFWKGSNWPAVVRGNREHFNRMLGATASLREPKLDRRLISESSSHTVWIVQWPILPVGNEPATSRGFVIEAGILILPEASGPHPAVIVVPDADRSAADIAGLTGKLASKDQTARQIASQGYVIFAPFFVERRTFCQPWTEDRNWLFRLGYQVGQHLIGSEVQQVLSAVTMLSAQSQVDSKRIAVAGEGQGGLTAFYASALDDRIAATVVSRHFGNRERAFDEPEDRTLWKQLVRFGDAEVAAMIAPRVLIVDRGVNAEAETNKAADYFRRAGNGGALHVASSNRDALAALADVLRPAANPAPAEYDGTFPAEELAKIANTQFAHWQARFRNLAMEAFAIRESAWRTTARTLPEFESWAKPKRELYLDTIGRYPPAEGPLDAKSTLLYDEPEFTGYRLSVGVYPGVHAYGILLVPKGITEGERRPVVFTQHGLQGIPEHALGVIADPKVDAYYDRFGWKLAKRGYVVFAPMISVQIASDRSALARRSHLIGLTPQGMEVRKFGRVIDYLSSLSFVDPERFSFYGLSYGGYTALWTAPAEPRFKAVISSGHFNDWDIKTSDITEGTSFLFHADTFDMFNYDLLHSFSHSEIAMLTAPRAFAVEIGDKDGVVVLPHRFVRTEMDRVAKLYDQLGISDRFLVASFSGPHKIDGEQIYPFLDRLLDWHPKIPSTQNQ
jgi:dienelactone hydrolase